MLKHHKCWKQDQKQRHQTNDQAAISIENPSLGWQLLIFTPKSVITQVTPQSPQ